MLILCLLLGFSMTLEMKQTSDTKWVAAHNSTAKIAPFEIVDDIPGDKYKLEVRYKLEDELEKEQYIKFAGTLEEVNRFLRNKDFYVGTRPTQDVLVKIFVHQPGHTQKIKRETSLKVFNQLPIKQLVFKTLDNSTFPLKIAQILAPFNNIPMVTIHKTHEFGSFILNKVGDYIELEPQSINSTFVFTFSIEDHSSNLFSPGIKLQITKPLKENITIKKSKLVFLNSMKAKRVIFWASVTFIVIFLLAIIINMIVSSRKRRLRVQTKGPVVVIRPAEIVRVRPGSPSGSTINRAELREAYQS